ncbi:MAG TPA: bifunctional chorismate mutase/prephenate dehydratase, partial [Lachnospiraceae bacterium]|nr:bifunctional chorismate mutase/prephenate dehydratase [Lachnospiraceae bacterium]
DLQESRKKIDEVDQKLLELFEYRMQLAKDVAAYKRMTGKAVYDP